MLAITLIQLLLIHTEAIVWQPPTDIPTPAPTIGPTVMPTFNLINTTNTTISVNETYHSKLNVLMSAIFGGYVGAPYFMVGRSTVGTGIVFLLIGSCCFMCCGICGYNTARRDDDLSREMCYTCKMVGRLGILAIAIWWIIMIVFVVIEYGPFHYLN